MTKIAIDKGRSLRILFAFKPERLLKGETRKRHDLFPRCIFPCCSTVAAPRPCGTPTTRLRWYYIDDEFREWEAV
jgi:hypothetical protein